MAHSSSNTAEFNTAELFVGPWWTVVLRGLTAVAFGLATFAWPHLTLATLVLLFGFYALIHGIFSLIAAVGIRQTGDRWLLALEGVVGIWAGVVTLRTPSTTAMVLIFFVWVWAIATGILRIAEAIRLRKEISGEVWLALSGVVTVLFAVMLMLRPVIGLIGLASLIAGYALILGLFEILLGWELRAMRNTQITGVA
jgi:uncharacterized membrane protein HdeD (DUF308 family)